MAVLTLAMLPPARAAQPPQLGIHPVPRFTTVTVRTAVSYDPHTSLYSYDYTVTNPATNTGSIYTIQEDVSAPLGVFLPAGSGLTIPRGHAGAVPFDDLWAQRKGVTSVPFNRQAVPFGSTAPSGWFGTLSVAATGGWHTLSSVAVIRPGEMLSGFNMLSYGSPTIRAMTIQPDWILDLGPNADEPTDAQAIQASKIIQSLKRTVYVLGPSAYNVGIGALLTQLTKDVTKAEQLGWISDAALAGRIQSQLQAAQTVYGAEGPDYNTLAALKQALNTVTAAAAGKLTADGSNLLRFALANIMAQMGNPRPATQRRRDCRIWDGDILTSPPCGEAAGLPAAPQAAP